MIFIYDVLYANYVTNTYIINNLETGIVKGENVFLLFILARSARPPSTFRRGKFKIQNIEVCLNCLRNLFYVVVY